MELELLPEGRECLKCGYVRLPSDLGPDYACPNCSAVYAKLEALQKAKTEALARERNAQQNLERRAALEERFEREQAKHESAEQPTFVAAHAVYLLMILPFAVTQAIAVALAFKMRRPAEDTWLNEHFSWQIRTFGYLALLSALAGISLLLSVLSVSALVFTREPGFVGELFKAIHFFVFFCVLAGLTTIYRVGKGWFRLSRREAP